MGGALPSFCSLNRRVLGRKTPDWKQIHCFQTSKERRFLQLLTSLSFCILQLNDFFFFLALPKIPWGCHSVYSHVNCKTVQNVDIILRVFFLQERKKKDRARSAKMIDYSQGKGRNKGNCVKPREFLLKESQSCPLWKDLIKIRRGKGNNLHLCSFTGLWIHTFHLLASLLAALQSHVSCL